MLLVQGLVQRSHSLVLELGASSPSGVLAFQHSGPLALLFTLTGHLWVQEIPGPPGA